MRLRRPRQRRVPSSRSLIPPDHEPADHEPADPEPADPEPASPRYSVVVPAFNEQAYLGGCLTSLAAQDYPGTFEIIVVDNGSDDDTAVIAATAGATVVFEPEHGVCQARQRGTEAARGEIVISTDADTTFSPGWLSAIDMAFARHPGAVAVAGPCEFVAAPGWAVLYPKLLFGAVNLIKRTTGRVAYVSATNFAFRKSVWTGYDTRLTQGGDELDLLRRLQARGEVIFDNSNPTRTSSRRLDQGLLYNIAVTFFYYYFLGYALNRAFGRPVLGMAPPFRRTGGRRTGRSAAPAVRPWRVARAAFLLDDQSRGDEAVSTADTPIPR